MSKLMNCPTCKHNFSQNASECPSCGEENDWIHPTIKKFVKNIESKDIDLGIDDIEYEFGGNEINFTAELKAKPQLAFFYMAKFIGMIIVGFLVGSLRNIMSLNLGTTGLWIHTIIMGIVFLFFAYFGIRFAYYGLKALFKMLAAGPRDHENDKDFDRTIRLYIKILDDKVTYRDPDDKDRENWQNLIRYFNSIYHQKGSSKLP